jgi:hypothetical protein
MALDGAGTRFVSAQVVPHGENPGGALLVNLAVQPNGSYPANGETLAALIALAIMGSKIKVPTGVLPDVVIVGNSNLGHVWSYDPALGTFRNWTAVGATPTEHATGAYGGNEATAVFRVGLLFPLYGNMSR